MEQEKGGRDRMDVQTGRKAGDATHGISDDGLGRIRQDAKDEGRKVSYKFRNQILG